MDSVEQLELWRSVRQDKEWPYPIKEQQEENERAEQLVRQIKQLSEYAQPEDE